MSPLPSGYLVTQAEGGRLACRSSEGAERFWLRNRQIACLGDISRFPRIEYYIEMYIYSEIWGETT